MELTLFETTEKGAVISDCKKYRYQLWRIWDNTLPKVLFIMMNPSKADANDDDPTIKRCISFAKSWGYGGFYVGNLYGYRATDPKELKKVDDPIGSHNRFYLEEMKSKCEIIICAWGNKQGKISDFDIEPKHKLHFIDLAKGDIPKHPLFLKGNLTPKRWTV